MPRLAEWQSKGVLSRSITELHYTITNIYFQPNMAFLSNNILKLFPEFCENYKVFFRKIGDFLLRVINNI